ncbi:MAG: VanZ family protein [Thermodesulfovibrionia bacterium]|nr:VanZ family protein [Thermodesulfovibrionia bacterium]
MRAIKGNSYLKKSVLFLILAFLTVFIADYIGLYEEVGPELLANNDFKEGFAHWKRTGPDDLIVLEDPPAAKLYSKTPQNNISFFQGIDEPGRFRLLKLSGDLKTEAVSAGSREWYRAGLVLAHFDAKREWISAPHVVVALTGDNPWKRYEMLFKIKPEAEQVRVIAQLIKVTGSMWVKNLSLREAVEKPIYKYWQFIYVLWFIFLAWLLPPLVIDCNGMILKAVVFFTVTVILFGALTPGTSKLQFQEDAAGTIKKITGQERPNIEIKDKIAVQEKLKITKRWILADKSGHFILFSILALSLAAGFSMDRYMMLIIVVAMFAGTTEVMQFFVDDRTPQIYDWLIDLSGAVSGFLLFAAVRRKISPAADPSMPQETID